MALIPPPPHRMSINSYPSCDFDGNTLPEISVLEPLALAVTHWNCFRKESVAGWAGTEGHMYKVRNVVLPLPNILGWGELGLRE